MVAAGVDGAGSVTQVAFQGRAAPAHPAAGLPLAEAVEELGRTALCVGVPDGALVGFAEGSDTHRARVCELDAGVHPWNDLARGGSFFASANNKERGRSVPAAHALSATVTRTARHPLCPGYAGGRKGRPLPVTCKKCTIYGATLRTVVQSSLKAFEDLNVLRRISGLVWCHIVEQVRLVLGCHREDSV